MLLVIALLMLSACNRPNLSPAESDLPQPAASPTVPVQPSPTPTQRIPLSTVEPANDGDRALIAGDYARAIQLFALMQQETDDPVRIDEGNLGLGQAYYKQGNFASALDYLRLSASSDDAIIAARSAYLMGASFEALQRYDEALVAYQDYMELRPGLIDSHVHEIRGDIFANLGNHQQAIISYQEALRTDPSGGDERLAAKTAVEFELSGDQTTALSLYQNLRDASNNDYIKAEMDLRIGRVYLSLEQPESAYPYFQDAVDNYPFAYDAYSALVTLVDDNIPVDDFQRGLINYNVGNYALAEESFARFLASSPEDGADRALYYQALAIRAEGAINGTGRSDEAIATWQQLIDAYPASEFYVDAWEDIEYTYWAYLDDPEAAAQAALRFVILRPDDAEAPDFLFLAGRSYERAGQLELASQTWERIASEYPGAADTFRATYFAGIIQVRLGNWVNAQLLFARALVLTSEPDEQAAAQLWIGKCQNALGDISAAVDSWKQAQTIDPFGYYSIRAEDLLIQQGVLTSPTTYDLNPDLSPYRAEAEAWLRTTFALPADTNLESPGLLANDPRFSRGLEFWSLGLYAEGKEALDDLRLAVKTDPADTFRLIPALIDIGMYRSALVASTDLLRSAGLEGATALTAPEFFSRIRFGAYYLDWILPLADSKNISPLLILSVVRQESAYEGFADSGAGARGLMQVIPSTGAQLATDLQWPENYTAADLYRPYVSLVFGVTYLARQRNYFDGDPYAMLAAYNGGPGNTIAWKALAPDDPDLFLESIRIEETRNYIRLITEIHYIYSWLYRTDLTP